MKLFYNLSGSILSALKRFPAVFLLTFCTAACASILTITDNIDGNYEDLERTLKAFACSSIWCAVLSFPAQLFAEQSRKKYLQTAIQVLCITFCFAWYFFCLNLQKDRFFLIYASTLTALLAISPFALKNTQNKNEIIPNIITSLFQAVIIVSAISVALAIIIMAIDSLFDQDFMDWILPSLLSFCWIAIFTDYFIVNVSKHHVDISIPRFLGVLFSSVLVPLYAIFMAVLYIYLIKCAVTKSFPMRDMNLFCSYATALFLILSLTLRYFDTKLAKIFYSITPFAITPLIIVQTIITIDRVKAHGISMNRYASILYIMLSIIFLVFSLMQKGRFLLHICPVLAVIALIAGLTPLNLMDVPIRSQTGIIYSVLKKSNLYEDGKILTDKTRSMLSAEDKKTIIRAYNKIKGIDTNPFKDFSKSFGFEISDKGIPDAYRYSFYIEI
nr:DUF4153 domain-containing protein [Treponema sp.]